MTRNVFWVNINMENMLMCKIFYKHLVGLSVSLCIGWSASPATHLLPKVSWGTRRCICLRCFFLLKSSFGTIVEIYFPNTLTVFFSERFSYEVVLLPWGVSNNQLRRSLIFPTQVFLWTLVRAWNVYLYDSITPK